jgi:hypothetical protein
VSRYFSKLVARTEGSGTQSFFAPTTRAEPGAAEIDPVEITTHLTAETPLPSPRADIGHVTNEAPLFHRRETDPPAPAAEQNAPDLSEPASRVPLPVSDPSPPSVVHRREAVRDVPAPTTAHATPTHDKSQVDVSERRPRMPVQAIQPEANKPLDASRPVPQAPAQMEPEPKAVKDRFSREQVLTAVSTPAAAPMFNEARLNEAGLNEPRSNDEAVTFQPMLTPSEAPAMQPLRREPPSPETEGHDQTRLVIGRLTVEVIPTPPATAPPVTRVRAPSTASSPMPAALSKLRFGLGQM